MRCEVAILYKPAGGEAVPLAVVTHRPLLLAVAMRAIQESDRAAQALAEADPLLGQMQHFEVRRLKDVLRCVLPELLPAAVGETVM